tara:strand:+ start:139 stop:972 length:834 start_codon:yes stop_codon:yes gene_type:complete
MSQASSDLANRRAEIDRIDREMQQLLQNRAKVVQGVVRAKKAATAAGEITPPFRPGREAEVLRTLVAHHRGDFPAASLLRIWREIISGATRIQAEQRILVVGGAGDSWDLARDHFGLGAVYEAVHSLSLVFDMLRQNAAAAAVLPMQAKSGAGVWWRELMQTEPPEGAPQVVARLPFFKAGTNGDAVVLSPFPPDASSQDRGVLGLTLQGSASPHELAGIAETAGLKPTSPALVDDSYAWLEVDGLVSPDAAAITAIANATGIADIRVLGGYAVPLA